MALKDKCVLHSTLGANGEITSPLIGDAGVVNGAPAYDTGQIVCGADCTKTKCADFPNTSSAYFTGVEGRVDMAFRPVGWSITNGKASATPTGTTNGLWFWNLKGSGATSDYAYVAFHEVNDIYQDFRQTAHCTPYYGISPALADAADGTQHVMTLVWNEGGIDGGSNTREIYWDGALAWSTTNALISVPIPTSSWSLFVGNMEEYSAGNPLDGKVNWLKVFDEDDNDMTGVMDEEFPAAAHIMTPQRGYW